MVITKQKIKEKLSEVLDPELNISIVDLGLVYAINIDKKNNVKLLMTLTTLGCPLFGTIEQEVKSKLKDLGITDKQVKIDLTFEPPWSMDRMSESAKATLGI